MDEFQKSVPGTTAKDVMNLVLMTQYFDMLKEVGASSRTNAILIPHSPGNLTSLTEQMRTAMIEANQMGNAPQVRAEPLPELRMTPEESRVPQRPGRGAAWDAPGNGDRGPAPSGRENGRG